MNVPDPMAYQFLRTFARAEFAMKGIARYCRGDEGRGASADWDELARQASAALEAALPSHPHWQTLMLDAPPQKEVVRGGVAVFDARPLGGGTNGEQLLQAVRRVRNNLFHGGKEQGERYPGHDADLVAASLEIIEHAVRADALVEGRFNTV